MTEAEFAAFNERAPREYADEKVASGAWAPADALRLAQENFSQLLPGGIRTAGHHFLVVRDSGTNEEVGVLWFAAKERAGRTVAYVYNIEINRDHRRKGHATRALLAMEGEVRALGLAGIELHVFGHNPGAHALYHRIGFRDTSIFMFKELAADAS
jgi:ribosomal protein S18 acetylase RimI-like enzyme